MQGWNWDWGTDNPPTLNLELCCYLHPPHITAHTHTHTYRSEGEGICLSTLGARGRIRTVRRHRTFRIRFISPLSFSFLPPSLSENNDGTSAAFEGRLNGSDSHGLWGVSGQLRVSPQLLEQLSVEGGRLGLSCYLSAGGRRGKGWGGYSQSHSPSIQHAESFTLLGASGKFWAGLLV